MQRFLLKFLSILDISTRNDLLKQVIMKKFDELSMKEVWNVIQQSYHKRKNHLPCDEEYLTVTKPEIKHLHIMPIDRVHISKRLSIVIEEFIPGRSEKNPKSNLWRSTQDNLFIASTGQKKSGRIKK